MLDLHRLLIDCGVLIALTTAIVLFVGVYRPRWFLMKKNVPADILAAVPPRTEAEKRQSVWAAIPLLLVMLGGTFYSTYAFGAQSGAGFAALFLHALVIVLAISLFDLIVIDWLVLNTITPNGSSSRVRRASPDTRITASTAGRTSRRCPPWQPARQSSPASPFCFYKSQLNRK